MRANHPDAHVELDASFHQERLWFIDRFESGNLYESAPVYHNIPLIVKIRGPLDINVLEQSMGDVINRHEALRTRVITVDNKPVQAIDPTVDFRLAVIDADENGEDTGSGKGLLNLAVREAMQPFFLEKGPLIRGRLIRVKNKTRTYLLVIALHHIIADKYSLEILLREILLHYHTALKKEAPGLPGLSLQYPDFSRWQRQLPASVLKPLVFHWKNKLRGELQALEISTDRPRALVHTYRAGRQAFTFSRSPGDKIRDFGSRGKIDHFTLLLAAFKVLLHRYSGLQEIIVGTFASVLNKARTGNPRNHPETAEVIGPFDNLLALRSFIKATAAFRKVAVDISRTLRDALKNQDMPFDQLVSHLNPGKDMSRTALFDVLFQYEEDPFQFPAPGPLAIKPLETNLGWGKYDLNLWIKREGDIFSGILVYNADYYDKTTIARMITHYETLLHRLLENPDQPISRLSYITAAEEQRLLEEWNRTAADYPRDKTLIHIFQEQVEAAPGAPAVIHENDRLTYRELNRQANRVARCLRDRFAVRPGDLVCITLERSGLMIVAILGILKSGAAYVPIDAAYPDRRVRYILNDSQGKLVVTHGKRLPGSVLPAADIRDLLQQSADAGKDGNPEIVNTPEDTAYVIYTSGTTGYPKGCMVTHRNVVRLLKNDKLQFDFNASDVWIMAHSFCFDFSVWEMYGALLNGGKLIVPTLEAVRDTGCFLSLIKQHRVTVLNQTPAAFYNLAAEEKKPGEKVLDTHLRYVIFGGDKLEPAYLGDWLNTYSLEAIRLINMYGITETTVHVTYYRLTESDVYTSHPVSPIGKPIPETTLYILNRDLLLEPVGVAGELYVGGSGVCRGYLNNQVLTAERFPGNPHKKGEILYRTGDLGKRLANGDIVFLGRIDQQVKIRGFRIEPGEIESQLLAHEEIQEAVVVNRKVSGDRCLCAYIVSREVFEAAELRDYLLGRLPDYMIPAYFVPLDKIPLTSNNKVDRKALPVPGVGETGKTYIPPGDELEKELVEIWSDILGLDPAVIGIHANFFDLGGHSLKAAALVSRIHKELDVKIPLVEVFKTPMIKGLAAYIKGMVKERFFSIPLAEEKEYYALSSAQKRMYSLQQLNEQAIGYNMPSVVVLTGSIQKAKLEDTFMKLITRHEALRTSFLVLGEEEVQKVSDPDAVTFEMEYYDSGCCAEITRDFIRPFDLSQAPLLRVGLIHNPTPHQSAPPTLAANQKGRPGSSSILMVDMHHIISDGVSHAVLFRDFLSLYTGEELPGSGIQYKDFSEWQNRLFKEENGTLIQQKEYWLREFRDEISGLKLSFDFERPAIKRYDGDRVKFVIDKAAARKVTALMKETGTTLNMVLLAIYNILLFKYTNHEDIVVGTPITGRRHTDLQDAIGMFVNMLAIRNKVDGNKTFGEFLAGVKQKVLDAMENQDYQFEQLISDLGLGRDPGKNPLFNVVFNMVNIDPGDSSNDHLTIEPYDEFEPGTTVFDLILTVSEGQDIIYMMLVYSTKLFKRSTIERITERYIEILDQVVENSKIKLNDISISHSLKRVRETGPGDPGDFGF